MTTPSATEPTAKTDPGPQKLDRGLLLVAAVVVVGSMMAILDTTVVNVAIRTLAQDFHTQLTTIQWVVTGYTLALATVIPLTGWGADRFGTKRLYVTSIVLFVSGSVLSGLAWNSGALITFRVLQGLGGGMLMPVGMTILTRAAGPQRVGRVMAVIGVPMLLGPIFGPILGGWLVDGYSWRWIFYINVPIGAVALFLALRVLPKDVTTRHERLDWIGLALLSPGLAALIYGLAQSGSKGGFGSAEVLLPALLGAAAIAMFIVHGLRTTDALIDLRLFANKVFSGAIVTLALLVIALFGGMLLLPLYLQTVRGESALDTGLLLAPQGFGAMIAMPIAGKLTDSTGVGKIVPVGFVIVGVGFIGLTQLHADTSYWLLSAWLFILGLGMGATMMPTFSGAMQTLRRAAVAKASTTLNIVQQAAASIGTAVLSVLLANALADKLGGGSGGGVGATSSIPPQLRAQIAPKMAAAFGQTFWWAFGMVMVALVVAAIVLPKHLPEQVEDDDEAVLPAAMLG